MKTDTPTDLTLDESDFEYLPDPAHYPASGAGNLRGRLGKVRAPSPSTLLRGLGGLVIVAAFVLFLFKGWQEGDELSRYLLLIGHTLVLSLAGFASGHFLHEGKGARLFIALALAAVPVNFAFLGGMSYEHLAWDSERISRMATGFWSSPVPGEAVSASAALPLTGAAVLVLGAAIWIGFLVMARRSAWSLTGLYLLANAGLLIPTRDTASVSVILLALGILLALSSVRLSRRDQTLSTGEGVFARSLLALPLLVIAGRSVWLYAPGELFFLTLSLIGYLGLRQALRHSGGDSGWRLVTEGLAVGLAVISALLLLAVLAELRALDDAFKLPLAAALLAGLLADLSIRATSRARAYSGAAALVVAAILVVNLAWFEGLLTSLVCLIGGILIQTYGYMARQRITFVMGLVAALAGAGYLGIEAFSSFSIGGWTGLVLAGVASVLAGSLIERHGERIKALAGDWNRHFRLAD